MIKSKWMNNNVLGSISKETDKYLHIEQPSSFNAADGSSNLTKAGKFDFELFNNLWGNFEFEEWILKNSEKSWDPSRCVTDYLIDEAVDQQIKSKLERLSKLKSHTEQVNQEKKKERIKKLNEINSKMNNNSQGPVTTFLPYDNPDLVGLRRRSRGLLYTENTELIKYQKRIGIPITKPETNLSYPSIVPSMEPLGKPIGKPTDKPVIPLPGQASGYPSMKGYHSSNMVPSPYPAAGLSQTQAPSPHSAYPSMGSHTPGARPDGRTNSGIKRWFGFN